MNQKSWNGKTVEVNVQLFHIYEGTSLVAQQQRIYLIMQEMQAWFRVGKYPLEKEMATHSSILAWEIPWAEESGKLQSTVLQRTRHNLLTEQ